MTPLNAPIEAFIRILLLPFEQWDIPAEYWEAISPHAKNSLVYLLLPWPVAALPRAHDTLHLTGLPSSMTGWTIIGSSFFYEKDVGIKILVETGEVVPDYSNDSIEVVDILHAAEEGFLFESEVPIAVADVLRRAGLPSSRDEYQAKKA